MTQSAVVPPRRFKRPPRELRALPPAPLAAGRLLLVAAFVGTIAGGCGAAASGSPAATAHVLAAAPAASSTSGTPTVAPTPSPRVAQLQALSATYASAFSSSIEAGFGAVWAASDDGLLKLSAPGTADVVLSGRVIGVALGSNDVFALVGGDTSELVEVDPRSGKALRHWELARGAKSLVVAGEAAYVDHGTSPATIDRIDLGTGSIRPVEISAATHGLVGGQALAAGDGLVWANDGSTVYGLDPTTLTVRKSGNVVAGDGLWFGDGSLWAASEQYGAGVHRIDPATVSETAHVGADAMQIAFSPHGVWLSAWAGPTEIDPTTAAVIARLPDSDVLGNDAAGIAVVGSEAWVVYKDSGQLQRIRVP